MAEKGRLQVKATKIPYNLVCMKEAVQNFKKLSDSGLLVIQTRARLKFIRRLEKCS